jgi:hypothetical protein
MRVVVLRTTAVQDGTATCAHFYAFYLAPSHWTVCTLSVQDVTGCKCSPGECGGTMMYILLPRPPPGSIYAAPSWTDTVYAAPHTTSREHICCSVLDGHSIDHHWEHIHCLSREHMHCYVLDGHCICCSPDHLQGAYTLLRPGRAQYRPLLGAHILSLQGAYALLRPGRTLYMLLPRPPLEHIYTAPSWTDTV